MNQDDYQKKIDEHRQSIGLEEEMNEPRRSRRTSYAKKTKKKSKNLLIPVLFFIFILIPICIFIYVQFFYTAEVENVTNQGVTLEKKTISNTGDDNSKEENDSETVVEQSTVVTAPEKEAEEESKTEEPITEVETKTTSQTEVETKPIEVSQAKTHIVQKNETLYRIAINYYKDPKAVEKIKVANGLKSDSISAGQKLVLP
ncbi:LysM peptidoglycan-binding domain-containing protein [Psychrobacillus glaciei]|uniref:LysM peptidoglycan-binding domain-containing protein n=1 Tax=Psychrobacillus glaciei TaxID=2283160 RepID=A0A5J6SL33_9BACI|nr:LysM peptidoglycan-binding domain-containing protein [Psychrobacillus glaciei]QFF98680.1 LysM peptidoglycan-binding domain-containing protein [Psychrobacillus glaciei]